MRRRCSIFTCCRPFVADAIICECVNGGGFDFRRGSPNQLSPAIPSRRTVQLHGTRISHCGPVRPWLTGTKRTAAGTYISALERLDALGAKILRAHAVALRGGVGGRFG